MRVVIGSAHAICLRGLRVQLEAEEDIEVIAEAADGAETVIVSTTTHPDVVVIEAGMPRLGALAVARLVRLQLTSTEVCIISSHFDEHLATDVFAAGARGFLLTSDTPEELITCVRALAGHVPFVSPVVRARMARLHGSPFLSGANGVPHLTRRERLIVKLIAEGMRTREIAFHLGISEKTVETHRAAIFRKLELDTLADVVRYAIRNSMIEA